MRGLPLPACGERGGVRGFFDEFDSRRAPLTRPRFASVDLSPQAGRGNRGTDTPRTWAEARRLGHPRLHCFASTHSFGFVSRNARMRTEKPQLLLNRAEFVTVLNYRDKKCDNARAPARSQSVLYAE